MLRKSYRRLKVSPWIASTLGSRFQSTNGVTSHDQQDPDPRTADRCPGKDWAENPRWKLVKRGYSAADVVRLRGSMQPEYTLAKNGAEKLWAKVSPTAHREAETAKAHRG